MQQRTPSGDLFIVDDSDAVGRVRWYLHDRADRAHSFAIATAAFGTGALPARKSP